MSIKLLSQSLLLPWLHSCCVCAACNPTLTFAAMSHAPPPHTHNSIYMMKVIVPQIILTAVAFSTFWVSLSLLNPDSRRTDINPVCGTHVLFTQPFTHTLPPLCVYPPPSRSCLLRVVSALVLP